MLRDDIVGQLAIQCSIFDVLTLNCCNTLIIDEHRNKSRDRLWAQGKVFAQIVRNLTKVGRKKQMPLMNDFCDLFFMVLYFGIIKMKKIENLKF